MKRCLICGGKFKNGAGLAAHRRSKHPSFKGANRIACEEMLAELERNGQTGAVDVAIIQMLRSLADQLDADPSNAQMWRTYRETVGELTQARDDSDETEDELETIRGTAKVGYLQAVR